MSLRIETDLARFREIIRGSIRKDLQRYITHSELIGKSGRDSVRIPVSKIRIPHFCFDPLKQGGVGQGQGKAGIPAGTQTGQKPQAGNAPGEHEIEAEFSLEELARILAEELELPSVQPRGKNTILTERERYCGLRQAGPESLRVMKRTYKAALRRQIMSRTFDPENPVIIPIREDLRYRSWKERPVPESNALIIYMMDVSGSMGDEQKEIVRTEAFWIDTWLRSQYQILQIRYVIHDAIAREVDEPTFYHSRESGGTIISSAYRLCLEIIEKQYDPREWNIYLFHFSDGDNWGEIDTHDCVVLLSAELLPKVNLFCYGQVESHYGSGQFIEDLKITFSQHDKVVLSEIATKDDIYRSIRQFLGKGK
jgi:sporulation protein YhbH